MKRSINMKRLKLDMKKWCCIALLPIAILLLSSCTPGLFPEGVAFDSNRGQFIVSSFTQGKLSIVDNEGNFQSFVEDDALSEHAALGLLIDESRNRILVAAANNDNSFAGLGVYDLSSGARQHFIDLAALTPNEKAFANDVTIDDTGTAYVTNTASGVIYKVTVDGQASIFYQDAEFTSEERGFNGIRYHPDGFLIVVFASGNQLYKFPLDNPADYNLLTLDSDLHEPDGISFSDDYSQLGVVNNQGFVAIFETSDNWDSGTVIQRFETGDVFPTALVMVNQDFYVLEANLNALPFGVFRSEFPITKVNSQ